jgi:hypothetical protein
MVSHSHSEVSDAQVVWNASSYQSSEYPSGSFMADSAQLSKESYDTTSKDASFSVATRSTYYADGSLQSYSDEEYHPVSELPSQPPPKEVEPTVFVLQHHISTVEDEPIEDVMDDDTVGEHHHVTTREEQETERSEVEKEPKSFSRFRKLHFIKKKKKSHESSTDRVPAPKNEDTEIALESSPSVTKKSLRGKGFLLASTSRTKSSTKEGEQPSSTPEGEPIESESKLSEDKRSLREKGFLCSLSKSSLKEGGEEQSTSKPRVEMASSNESDDNDKESTVGGTLNTFELSMFLGLDDQAADEYTRDGSTLDGNEASAPPDQKHAPRWRRSSSRSIREASTVAATAESLTSRDDLSIGMTIDDGEKSVKSNKSNRSSRSNRSNISIRSLGSIFKRKNRDGSNGDLYSTKSEDNERKFKKKRSWNPLKRRRSKRKSPPPTATKKPKKSILRKRNTPRVDSVDPRPAEEEQSPWEAFLEGCDVVCCKPLFGENGSDSGSVDSCSHTPSEIYINTESSKTLVTV